MNENTNKPIGVFDSGLGGLTVLKAMKKRLPKESFIYYGDTGHLPYGSKSREGVIHYSLKAAGFLMEQDIKMLVVACNTASAVAIPALRTALPVAVLGVIDPGARAALKVTDRGSVGVIGTDATINSHAYREAILKGKPYLKVVEASCPLFVPLVEEGWWTHKVTKEVAAEYLKPIKRAKPNALILGCTHYPFLKKVIQAAVGKSTMLIDSAEEMAQEVDELLQGMGIKRKGGGGAMRFYASDDPERFRKLGRKFGMPVEKVVIRRFD